MNQESRDLRTQKQSQQVWDVYKKQRKEEKKLKQNNDKELKKLLRK
jgi:Spy/CpxP family protein refolding chaperone